MQNCFELFNRSVTYLSCRPSLIGLIGVVAFINTVLFHVPDSIIYAVISTLISVFWALWIAVYVVFELDNKAVSLQSSFLIAFKRGIAAWWWPFMLACTAFFITFFVHMPQVMGENVGLILISIGSLLWMMQRIIDFYMIPYIADGASNLIEAIRLSLFWIMRQWLLLITLFLLMFFAHFVIGMLFRLMSFMVILLCEYAGFALWMRDFIGNFVAEIGATLWYALFVIIEVYNYKINLE